MRKTEFAAFGLFILLLLIPFSLRSQTVFSDSSVAASLNQAINLYNQGLQDQTNLFNGAEYIEDHPGISGTRFWQHKTPQAGAVFYDGILYPLAVLAYDAVNDNVVVRNNQQLSLKPASEKIKWFTIGQAYFVHLTKDSFNTTSSAEPGFYNMILSGRAKVYAKRKRLSVRVLQPTDHYEYQEEDKFFVALNNNLVPVSNKADLLNAFPDKKDQLKKFIRSNNLNVKKEPEGSLVKVAAYYNALNK